MSKKKKVIITGVTGFIGQALALKFLNDGAEVFGIGRNPEKFAKLDQFKEFHKYVLDFEQYDDISKLIKEEEIDFFFHTAYRGVNGPKKSDCLVQLQNLEVACKTVFQAIELGVKRYLYIGSVDEYEITKFPDKEFNEPTHSRIYAAIKYSSEVIGKVLAYENKLEYVCALLSLTYGEGNNTNILPNMIIRNAHNSEPINLISGNDYFDMISINEAINGIIAVATEGKCYESYFIGHEKLRTFKEIVISMCETIGYTGELNFGKYPDPSFAIEYDKIDRKKLYKDTGYRCEENFSESILETKKWLGF